MMNQQVDGLGYGYLYNWYAASHANFVPTDWKVPLDSEFDTLRTTLGGWDIAGGKLKETGTTYWDSPNTGATNSSGFKAYGAGNRTNTGAYVLIKKSAHFWGIDTSGFRSLQLKHDNDNAGNLSSDNKDGQSIRLLYTGTGSPTTMTDYDGNTYDVVLIGTQRWTVQNWKCTKLNNGTALTKVTNATTWAAAGAGNYYYCAYNNDEGNV